MKKILLSKQDIEEAAERIGKQISDRFANDEKAPLLVVVMRGGLFWMGQVFTHVTIPVRMDYIDIISYDGTESTGKVTLQHDVTEDCEGRSVIIVEDIIDTGLSMDFLIKHLESKGPKGVYVCALLDKVKRRKIPVRIDFLGKQLDDTDFVLGFGFDYDGLERNVPYVYSADQADIDRLAEESKH